MHFGEIKNYIKEREQFSSIIESLENLVMYENDCEIIDIHTNINISAPPKEYSRVIEYKLQLKTRKASLLEN
jgi:hypothetical protein